MSAPTNPKATPRSSERFKEVVSLSLPSVLLAFFLEDIVAQPLLAVLLDFFLEASNRNPGTGVLQIPFCRE
jgi:hypothetical protein